MANGPSSIIIPPSDSVAHGSTEAKAVTKDARLVDAKLAGLGPAYVNFPGVSFPIGCKLTPDRGSRPNGSALVRVIPRGEGSSRYSGGR